MVFQIDIPASEGTASASKCSTIHISKLFFFRSQFYHHKITHAAFFSSFSTACSTPSKVVLHEKRLWKSKTTLGAFALKIVDKTWKNDKPRDVFQGKWI